MKGNLNFLAVDADMALLPRTDVTYIVSSAESRIGLQNTSDMVRFVNFADSAAVAMADSVKEKPSMALMIDASLDVRQGSTITADLSTDGQNRMQIQGDGILSLHPDPGERRRTPDRTVHHQQRLRTLLAPRHLRKAL